jgi:hypothetical protein
VPERECAQVHAAYWIEAARNFQEFGKWEVQAQIAASARKTCKTGPFAIAEMVVFARKKSFFSGRQCPMAASPSGFQARP